MRYMLSTTGEMVAAACEILYLDVGAGKRLFNFELKLFGIHCRVS